jgi:hypothetical protein
MKIAVLLTGQLRTFEMVKYLHMNALIQKYDTDVFLGIDLCNHLQNYHKNSKSKTSISSLDSAVDFFKPIDTFVLDDFTDEMNRLQLLSNKCKRKSIELLFRQYYVVKNTYNLLINHIQNTEQKYDFIIRLRFDQLIFSNEVPMCPGIYDNVVRTVLYNEKNAQLINDYTKDKKFEFNELNDNTLYVFNFGDFKHYKYANDQFFYHTPSILTNMFEFYDNILPLMTYASENNMGNSGAFIECIFYLYITKLNNITFKRSNIHGIFIREFIERDINRE